jgi:hypothetical protein
MSRRAKGLWAAILLVAVLGGASAAQASGTQVTRPGVLTVEADKAPVLAGSGREWDGPAVAVIDSGVDAHSEINLAGQANCYGSGGSGDANGHGTAVAGYIGARDNGFGIVGIAPGVPVYSVRVLGTKNDGSVDTIVCGLQWVIANAAEHNIRVVNLSVGTEGVDDGDCGRTNADDLHEAVCALTSRGIVVVASAANSATDLARYIPAAYDEVLTATNVTNFDGLPGGLGTDPCGVGATDDTPASKSNYAVSAADRAHTLAAPGVCPYTTLKGNRYGYVQSGTSLAAAALTGVVLDCLRAGGACAGATTVAEVHHILISQARAAAERGRTFAGDPLSPVTGRYYGYLASTVPAGGATPTPTPTPTSTPTPVPSPTPTPTSTPTPDTTAPTVAIVAPADNSTVSGAVAVTVLSEDNVATTGVVLWSGRQRLGDLAYAGNGTWWVSVASHGYRNGTYPLHATAVDAAGNTGTSAIVSVTIAN